MKTLDYLAQYGARAMCYTYIPPKRIPGYRSSITIGVDAVRDFIKDHPLIHPMRCAVDPSMVKQLREVNAIEQSRIDELRRRPNLDPVIFAIWGNEFDSRPGAMNGFLLEGAHRYALAIELKMQSLPGFLLPECLWSAFVLRDFPDCTKGDLVAMPNLKRSY